MAYRTMQDPAQRATVLAGVVAAHGVLLLLLIIVGASRPLVAPLRPVTVSTVSLIDAAPAPTPPPPPTLPSKIAETARPLVETPPAIETIEGSTSLPAGGCQTTEAVSVAMLSDPLALAAILASPPETRSIADAIVLWNVGWSAAAPLSKGPLSAVRTAVEAKLRLVDPSCLEEDVAGPRLFPVPNGERTTFIVIGSGNWRWRDLLAGIDGLATDGSPPPAPASPAESLR